MLLCKTSKVLWVKSDICIISYTEGKQQQCLHTQCSFLLSTILLSPKFSYNFFFLARGRFAMYDVHYLCRARYDSYSCLHQVSPLLSDCVKVSDVLTMPLSFRSNVNYIPPPQEVSLIFVSSQITPSPQGIVQDHISETNKNKSVVNN